MIYDKLERLDRYKGIKYIDLIKEFLSGNQILDLLPGDIRIKGDDLFVKVLKYSTRNSSQNFFETHQDYMDIQIILSGVELMQVVQPEYVKETNEFKLDGDFKFYKATERISDLVVGKNEFVIFNPGEPHKPGCSYLDTDSEIFKLVFKVKV